MRHSSLLELVKTASRRLCTSSVNRHQNVLPVRIRGRTPRDSSRNYQRKPKVTGISLVSAPTAATPNPFGEMADAGVRISR